MSNFEPSPETYVEPWLSGTLTEYGVVHRALLHSLQMVEDDIAKWCVSLSDEQLQARPCNLPSLAFHLRHIARSLDRFCTYAEGAPLSAEQLRLLSVELTEPVSHGALFNELKASLDKTRERLQTILLQPLDLQVGIGRKQLPTTLAGLLIHAAEHTQRHLGQAITTAKVILAEAFDSGAKSSLRS